MGVGQKRQRAKDYNERLDEARLEEIELTTLGEKEVQASLVVDCELHDESTSLTEGIRVRLLDLKGERVEVFRGGRQIGVVNPMGSATLRERFGIAGRKGRSIGATVDHVSEFTQTFMALVD